MNQSRSDDRLIRRRVVGCMKASPMRPPEVIQASIAAVIVFRLMPVILAAFRTLRISMSSVGEYGISKKARPQVSAKEKLKR